jgi:hypothetical protein
MGFIRLHLNLLVFVAAISVAVITTVVLFSLSQNGNCPPQFVQQITGHYCAGFNVQTGVKPVGP